MRYKKYILNNLLLPVFACLLAGLAGCSNEVVPQDEGDNPDDSRRSSFSVSVRGVVTDNATDASGLYVDDYVYSIRILAFDSNGAVKYNQLFESEVNAATDDALAWTIATSTEITIERQELSLERGNYTFYFIANEKGHTLADATANNLAEQLKDKALTLDDLKAIKVTYDAPSADKPILMTAEKTVSIIPGVDVNITNVELVRTIAKVELQIRKSADNTNEYTYSELKITGSIPTDFSLCPNESYYYTPATSSDVELKEVTLTDENSTEYTAYIAYLPERLLNTVNNNSANALIVQFTSTVVGGLSTTYNKGEMLVGENWADNPTADFNVYRNKAYRIIATLSQTDPYFNFESFVWNKKEINVTFDEPEYTLGSITGNDFQLYKNADVEYYEVKAQSGPNTNDGGTMEIPFKLTGPAGARWVATFTESGDAHFILENSSGRAVGKDEEVPPIKITALNKSNAETDVHQYCVLQILVDDMPLKDETGTPVQFKMELVDKLTTIEQP